MSPDIGPNTSPGMNPDEQRIRALIDTWCAASADGDLVAQMNLMTEDALFLNSSEPPMRREDFAARFKSMINVVRIKFRSNVQEITVSGDLAVCWNLFEVDITPIAGGAIIKRAGNTLTVFRRGADGQWRVWRDANLMTTV